MVSSCDRPLFEVLKDLFDDRRIFDTGDNLDGTATLLTDYNINVEHAF